MPDLKVAQIRAATEGDRDTLVRALASQNMVAPRDTLGATPASRTSRARK